jgi:hypothetical protein
VGGMQQATIQQIINIAVACGGVLNRCGVIVTGGTEPGHESGQYSHGTGYKVDLTLNSAMLNAYLQKLPLTGERGGDSGGPIRTDSCGNQYVQEANHWDITVTKACGAGAQVSCSAPAPIPATPPATCFGRSVVFRDFSPEVQGDGSGIPEQAPNRLWFTIKPGLMWVLRIKTGPEPGYQTNVGLNSWQMNIGFISEAPCDFTGAVQHGLAEQGIGGPSFRLPVLADNQVEAFRAQAPSWQKNMPYLKPNTYYYLHMLYAQVTNTVSGSFEISPSATDADLAVAPDDCTEARAAAGNGNCYYIFFENLLSFANSGGGTMPGLPAPTPNASNSCTAGAPAPTDISVVTKKANLVYQ